MSEKMICNRCADNFGIGSQYTAVQAADAMGFMGKVGWDAEEMSAGIGVVMDLTAASGEDLASGTCGLYRP